LRRCTRANSPRHSRSRGQHALLARRRHRRARRHRGRVLLIGRQLHDLDSGVGAHGTLHRQTRKSQTDTTHYRYGQPRRAALLSLLQNTARIKELRDAFVQVRRTKPTSDRPLKIEEPDCAALAQYASSPRWRHKRSLVRVHEHMISEDLHTSAPAQAPCPAPCRHASSDFGNPRKPEVGSGAGHVGTISSCWPMSEPLQDR
jgi:hypothetical protein